MAILRLEKIKTYARDIHQMDLSEEEVVNVRELWKGIHVALGELATQSLTKFVLMGEKASLLYLFQNLNVYWFLEKLRTVYESKDRRALEIEDIVTALETDYLRPLSSVNQGQSRGSLLEPICQRYISDDSLDYFKQELSPLNIAVLDYIIREKLYNQPLHHSSDEIYATFHAESGEIEFAKSPRRSVLKGALLILVARVVLPNRKAIIKALERRFAAQPDQAALFDSPFELSSLLVHEIIHSLSISKDDEGRYKFGFFHFRENPET